MRRFVTILGAMLIAVGCATNWVHPDPDADWDAAYADCSPKDEAANGGETNEQAMKDCLEAKGWVEQQTSKPPQRRRWRGPPQVRPYWTLPKTKLLLPIDVRPSRSRSLAKSARPRERSNLYAHRRRA